MKKAYRALRPFNRNVDGRMVVGHPQHRKANGRVFLLSEAGGATLESQGLVEPIDMRDYYDELQRQEDEGDQPGPERQGPSVPRSVRKFMEEATGGRDRRGASRETGGRDRGRARGNRDAALRGAGQTGRGRSAGAVRREAAGRVGGGEGGDEPNVTMSKKNLRTMAEARGIDLEKFDAAKNNRERVALIKGGGGGGDGGDMSQEGRVAGQTAATTNHPGGQDGLTAAADAAPTGGGGQSGE